MNTTRARLTKAQFNELLNQHAGTGYAFIKMNDSTVKILEIYVGKNGTWRTGLDGQNLIERLGEIAIELAQEEDNEN